MVRLQPQSLVRRGEILLGFDVINNWDKELKQMNKDKVGEPALLHDYFKSFFVDVLVL